MKTLAGKTKLALVDVNSITKKMLPVQPVATLPPVSSVVRPKVAMHAPSEPPTKLISQSFESGKSAAEKFSAAVDKSDSKRGRPAKSKGQHDYSTFC